ncbi:tRNA pseudouridine synthase Pus10 [Labeo rohita]|uniref:tRNA pseudouridine synthase Pus10 n=1 Tax=Labeo rohita TaxID=84645 RepID=A0ABQ8L0A9_LABRO|nr:tRNA pseudouridine synthase Pus10 [Labeo rohita]
MAVLQLHQAKALKRMHESSTDPRLMQELRSSTDFTLQTGQFSDTVKDFAQQFLAVQKQTEAIQHILAAALPHAEATLRPACQASHRRAAPSVSQPAPKSSRKSTSGPDTGNPEMCCQARGLTVSNALPPHLRLRHPLLTEVKRLRLGDTMSLHTSLASPSRNAGSSAVLSQNATPSVPSSMTFLHCTTAGTLFVPLVPLAQSLGVWLTLPNSSCRFYGLGMTGSGMTVLGPSIRAVPIPLCLYENRRGHHCPVMGSRPQDLQLSGGTTETSVATVTPLGLLHMRPLHAFLWAGVPLEQVSQCVVSSTRCLQYGLGCYMQRAGSLGVLDRALTALAHQMPGVAGSASSLAAVPAAATRQACVGPYGQHCSCVVH